MRAKILLLILTFSLTAFSQSYKKQFFEIDCNGAYTSHIAEVDRSRNAAIISVREDDLYTCWYISDVSGFKSALIKFRTSFSNFLRESEESKKEVKKIMPISFPLIDVIWSYQNENPKRRNDLSITASLRASWACFFGDRNCSSRWGKWVQLSIEDYNSGKGINSYLNMDMDALNSLIDAL